MMTLQLMRSFFQSVTSEGRSPIADLIAAHWVEGDAVVEAYRASANFVFSVEALGERFFLRFNHESERNIEAIRAELAFQQHLGSSGIHVDAPIRSTSGNWVEQVSTEMGRFNAVLFKALSGEHREVDQLDLNSFRIWGRSLGELHAAGVEFSCEHRPSWREHIQLAGQMIPCGERGAHLELQAIGEALGRLSSGGGDFGLIHFDFELDNLKWHDGQVHVLDFDDCAFYWFEADIAFALRDLFDDSCDQVDLECPRVRMFFDGYRSVKHLSEEALGRIPMFVRLHNLLSAARLTRSLGTGADSKEPGWIINLRGKLEDARRCFLRPASKSPIA
ncbi:MAG: phosphotransferase [bacterium]|nr:phosphotransferase [bacterium]